MGNDEQHKQQRRPTMQDVAAALKIAVSSVSNAYNRPDQLSTDLRERVLDKAAELGYGGPDPVARSLRQQRAGAVGVLFAERLPYAFDDPVAVNVLDGIAGVLDAASLGMLLVPGRGADFTTMAQQALVDGFIVYSMLEDNPLVATVLARRLPTVLLDQSPRNGVPTINTDDVDGARQAADILLRLGHQRFAVVVDRLSDQASRSLRTMPDLDVLPGFVARRRLQGYRAAIESAGASWNDVLLYECVDNSESDGATAMRALLERSPRPTAVLCLTDRLALGAIAVVRQAGLDLPGDLSIVGFDDIPRAALAQPALTTVRQDHREKGRRAGQALVALLHGRAATAVELLPVHLIVRATTGDAALG